MTPREIQKRVWNATLTLPGAETVEVLEGPLNVAGLIWKCPSPSDEDLRTGKIWHMMVSLWLNGEFMSSFTVEFQDDTHAVYRDAKKMIIYQVGTLRRNFKYNPGSFVETFFGLDRSVLAPNTDAFDEFVNSGLEWDDLT